MLSTVEGIFPSPYAGSENIYNLIDIDEHAAAPKYLQLMNCIVKAIQDGKLQKHFPLPSINDLSYELDLGRSTIEKTYRNLKKLGVIDSFPGKGYYINQSNPTEIPKILLLFNKLSAQKKIVYDTFIATLGESAAIDIFIYNNDSRLFNKILNSKKGNYNYYVVVPHIASDSELVNDIINELQPGNLILLDKYLPGVEGEYGAVYENFRKDIYTALKQALPRMSKYHTLKIIFPPRSYFSREILVGFQMFCTEFDFNCRVVSDPEQDDVRAGELNIVLMDDDLVTLLEKIQRTSLVVGKDVGIISYNEAPWKKFILNGITTISTDFRKMGEMAAVMILEKSMAHLEVPFTLTMRDSI